MRALLTSLMLLATVSGCVTPLGSQASDTDRLTAQSLRYEVPTVPPLDDSPRTLWEKTVDVALMPLSLLILVAPGPPL